MRGTCAACLGLVLRHEGELASEGVGASEVGERAGGLQQLRVIPWAAPDKAHALAFDEPTYMAFLDDNPSYETSTVRFFYSSLTTPNSIFDYDMEGRKRTLMKRDEILGGFAPGDYTSERITATARDGTAVPISLAFCETPGQVEWLRGWWGYNHSFEARLGANVGVSMVLGLFLTVLVERPAMAAARVLLRKPAKSEVACLPAKAVPFIC